MSEHVIDQDGLGQLLDRPGVRRVLAALSAEGEATRLVGGCVRDALLGRAGDDIDLTTTLLPPAVIARAEAAGLRAIPTGIEHGTVTLLADEAAFEVTTLREDVETDGRHAVVRFGRDFALDAQRRDFTINALSLTPDGKLRDTTGGVDDLRAGRVRFIGEPRTRIREDALRILRFFRFHARYGAGPPDPDGLSACIDARDALDGLSRERIRAEFLKLLLAPGVATAVATLSETGLLLRLIGGFGDRGRLARALAKGETTSAIDRLAALAVWSASDAGRLELGLRLSKTDVAALVAYGRALGALHGRAIIDGTEVRRLAADHDRLSLALARTSTWGEPTPVLTKEADRYLDDLADGRITAPIFPLGGADLVARGVRPGPEIGRRLARARARWLDLGCPNDPAAREALLEHAAG